MKTELKGLLMIDCPRVLKLALLLVVLLGVASCVCDDRDERIAKARERHGIVAEEAGTEVVVELSPGAQLFRDKSCHTCHGEDGINSILPSYPVIARQGYEYALQQMKDIQSGGRHNGQTAAMKALVQGVTEEEFAILADFIANELGDGAPIGLGNPDPESPGGKLFQTKTCWGCHGKDGVSPILPEYPRIAGLTPEYAIQQMTDIKSGARANSMAVKGMQGIMHLVNEDEIKQLAEYIHSMPR